ncbi:SUF system NifU family Fe-S cluster assembly protein [Photobacterium sp. SDRW27]|uniref:Fe-S cluster assembly sulfur transfer protein SufU n=1 Tax=Photobacterium obscurum TaxID=2829490 RepID=UPI002244E76E|nr:SUF system NifU family Fe-S cluster assembly protein [Photobacterium obscurum]MCW8331433.1 SUF system NifU family Fe-S cluster assembly protein [Photobacterium obscurum]
MNEELRELYQELIIDHGRHPRNFKKLDNPTYCQEGFNPLCGDRLVVYLRVENDCVVDASFEGTGCAISVASASLMTEQIKGKTLEQAERLFKAFHQFVTEPESLDITMESLGKLTVLGGVREFPSRIKCATLAWHTLKAGLDHQDPSLVVSTE